MSAAEGAAPLPLAAEAESTKRASKDKTEYHFGGPGGALALTVLMPLISIYLWMCIHENGGALLVPTSGEALGAFARAFPLPTLRAWGILLAFLALQAALQIAVPGRKVLGQPLKDGVRLPYTMNGWRSFWITVALLGLLFGTGTVRASTIVAELGPLLSAATVFAFALGAFLYVYGYRSPREERRSGNVVYDFFMGTALNPRIGDFDLKLFFEARSGMVGWGALVVTLLAAQLERGEPSTALVLVTAFQLLYIADFFWFEDAMLTTWDILYENYGFMLAHAFLVWMPFNFSLQSQYLLHHAPELPVWAVAGLVVLNLAGYVVFRSSNLQKHRFRTQPDALIWGKPPTFIKTQRGTLLLTSGWWGLARHTNYLGDLTMALAWCLTCGFGHLVPWFYFLYFAPLLLDRERRDHHVCAKKYGADWVTYCEKVPYRIVPYVY